MTAKTAVKKNIKRRSGKLNGWGARIQTCVLQVQALRRERLSLEDFGALVAKEQGRADAYKKATVSQWGSEYSEPTIGIFEAIARLADCDPWWIVWGVGRSPANVLDAEMPLHPRSGKKAKATVA